MAWDKGFNFRATSTYVTDGTNETYVLAEVYPTTRNGVTFGYASNNSLQTRDRAASVDRRLAGLHFDGSVAPSFRVDLPAAGQYDVRLALGDQGNNQTIEASVKDGATALIHLGPQLVLGGHALDATGTDYSDAAWPGSNSPARITMSGAVLTLTGPVTTGSDDGMWAHLFLSQVSSGDAATGTLTEAGESLGGAATVTDATSASATQAGESASGSATAAAAATGAATEAGESAAGTASAKITATGATTEGGESVSGTATVSESASGAATEAGESLSGFTGQAPDQASGAITQGGESASGTSASSTTAAGSGSETESLGGTAGVTDAASGATNEAGEQLGGGATAFDGASGSTTEAGESLSGSATSTMPGAPVIVRIAAVVQARYRITTQLQSRYRVSTLIE